MVCACGVRQGCGCSSGKLRQRTVATSSCPPPTPFCVLPYLCVRFLAACICTGRYVRIICAILDIPVHANIVESLHVLFTLFSDFKSNQHFGGQQAGGDAQAMAFGDAQAGPGGANIMSMNSESKMGGGEWKM